MEEPNKKPQDPDTLDQTTHSPLLYKLMKEDAQAEIRVLKMKYASVLRNCIMSRREKVLTTLKNVAAKHLDLDEIVLSLMDDDSDDDDHDDHDDDDDDSDDKVEEKEEERIDRNKSKGIVINDPSERAEGKAPMIYDTSEKRKGKAPMIYSTSEKCKGNAPMIYGTSDNSNGKEPMIVGSTENSKGKEPMIDGSTENSKDKEAEIDGTRDKSKGKEPTIDGSIEKTKGKETEIDGTSDKSKGKESMLDGSSEKVPMLVGSTSNYPNKRLLKLLRSFDSRLVEAVQNPRTRESVMELENEILQILGGNKVGAMLKLPFLESISLRSLRCLIARRYGLRPVGKSTTLFATKKWAPPLHRLWHIPVNSLDDEQVDKEVVMDDTGEKAEGETPMVVDTGEKESLVDGTCEKSQRKKPSLDGYNDEPKEKETQVLIDYSEDKVLDKKPADLVFESGNVVHGYWYRKLGLRLNQTEAPSPQEMNVDDYQTSESEEAFLKIENEDNLMSRKRNRDHKWENEEDMLLYLKTHRWLQLDAICALYRHERMIREQTTNRLAESNFDKITLLVEFLTNGIGHGPRVRTLNELEEIYRGSTALGSWLVVTYANQLYRIFCNKSDLYFC